MMQNKRVLTYVVIALIVGAALALAVALASNRSETPTAVAGGTPEASATALYSDSSGDPLVASDPAKQQPLLDQFTSKDPFIPLPTPGATSASTPSPNPSSTSQPTSNLSAKVKVDGTTYNVAQGDKVPGGSAAEFTISSVTSSDVTFKLISGSLKNGDKSFSVNQGESVRVTLDSGISYDVSVVSIGQSGGGGTSTSISSHSISVLSVSSQNGTPLVTIKVDSKTYSDLKQGDVVTTAWGQIKIVAIDVGGQTVTIMHGDQTLTLSAGEVVVK